MQITGEDLIVKELYENADMLIPGTTFQYEQLSLVCLGTSGKELKQGAPSGEVAVKNNGKKVESITPQHYESAASLKEFIERVVREDPKSLRDWLNRS